MRRVGFATAGFLAMCAVGCGPTEDGEGKYREPLPEQGSVSLKLPGSGGSISTSSVRTLNENGGSTGVTSSEAEFYAFSREVTDSIDQHTALVVGLIWLIVQNPATTLEDHRAVWGPYHGNALDPVAWRLVVTEVQTGEYDYSLEGRPKSSTNAADFESILKGHGYGKSHASHGQGWFQADNEAYRALDPARGKDRGTTKVDYDLRQFPQTIAVALRPNDGTGEIDATVEHRVQGAGLLTLSAHADIEDDGDKDGNLETIGLKSQWNSTGAGRADIQIAGGSLPIAEVKAVECWSSSFTLAYYKDTVDSKPSSGDINACAF